MGKVGGKERWVRKEREGIVGEGERERGRETQRGRQTDRQNTN